MLMRQPPKFSLSKSTNSTSRLFQRFQIKERRCPADPHGWCEAMPEQGGMTQEQRLHRAGHVVGFAPRAGGGRISEQVGGERNGVGREALPKAMKLLGPPAGRRSGENRSVDGTDRSPHDPVWRRLAILLKGGACAGFEGAQGKPTR
jgi:hypothetical protein